MERTMMSAFRFRFVLSIGLILGVGGLGAHRESVGQIMPGQADAPIRTIAADSYVPGVSSLSILPATRFGVVGVPPRGPLARLVKNDDTSGGLPPFALADQSGAIQRYVEPLPAIDLDPYVGSVVTVRHDTGRTLLASQLELPPISVGLGAASLSNEGGRGHRPEVWHGAAIRVQRAQFLDDDDSTVELMDEGSTNVGIDEKSSTMSDVPDGTLEPIANHGIEQEASVPYAVDSVWSDGAPTESGPVFVDSFPPGIAPSGMGYEFDQFGHSSHPHQPYYEDGLSFEDFGDSRGLLDRTFNSPNCRLFADAEFILMRLHLAEGATGKLSEQYKFSPRFIIGFEGGDISDGRIRFWTYDHRTPILEAGGGSVRFELEVLDIEATQRFQIRRSDIVVGAGLRMAQIIIGDDDRDEVGTDLIGMTVAADARTHLCRFENGEFSWIYGARLSILGGDWGGDPGNDLVAVPAQDDNVVTNELRAGIEYSVRHHRVDWQARLAFEMQNWHSDVFARDATADTIGFIGPAVHLGAQF